MKSPRKKAKKVTATEILDALDRMFVKFALATFRELDVDGLRRGPLGKTTFSRIDYWAISVEDQKFPLQDGLVTTYAIEVKTSRNDFHNDLKNPQKQRWALMNSNQLYYCAPVGVIQLNELPPYAGLLEYDGKSLIKKVEAPWRESFPPRWSFVASLLDAAVCRGKIPLREMLIGILARRR